MSIGSEEVHRKIKSAAFLRRLLGFEIQCQYSIKTHAIMVFKSIKCSYIVVQDIFDKEQYYQEYKLENVSPVAADFIVDGYFNTKGNVNITYLSGDDYSKTNYTIVILPKGKAE